MKKIIAMSQEHWETFSLKSLGQQIDTGQLDPRELVDYFLDRINQDEDREKIFIQIYPEEARQAADKAYERAKNHQRLSLYDGIPLVWKDNFDIAGKPSTAGLPILRDKIAQENAAIYQIALDSGLICLGKTNMTELAFSGLGINPSFGTPRNPFDARQARVPGGSSSGSAVAVAKGLCCAGIGTDTGGSIRTPAAWNNLVGLKTTAGLLSTQGIVPLSQTLDTVGFLTRQVEDAGSLYHLFTQQQPQNLAKLDYEDINLLVCTNIVWEQINSEVAETLEVFLEKIACQGVKIDRQPIPEFEQVFELVNTYGNIVSYEASKNWLDFLLAHPDSISPEILERFRLGSTLTSTNINKVHQGLQKLREQYLQRTQNYQGVVMPTVVSIPPIISELEQDSQRYNLENLLSLRNTRPVNLLGLSALSVPVGMTKSQLPVGLMLVAPPLAERILLELALALETFAIK
jgi:aspartyl-tRNA(Asn)/glutamyl-tRNA(Gln) amidotransferase subunit A